ncbi:MAG: hypothetical protein WEA58_06590 [Balneolaceae bacterium]
MEWKNLTNDDVSVRAFEQISDNKIIASLHFNNTDSLTIGLTNNFGENWSQYRNGYDPMHNSIPGIIIRSKEDKKTVNAGGTLLKVAKSADSAESWDVVFGSWDGLGSIFFIESTNSGVWTGGTMQYFHQCCIDPIMEKPGKG